ncbi:mRNA polyadenylation protein [Malassezia pachydermatis]|uniref:Cleavage and polyadenylation specificity protein n=1 Tax=Malassezia pachydermatis TaxID=77020 RepID=A0A0M8MJU3_9BASI|nr:cleavage and polyadenylation specificity protein [Malassezia pachydermatis]KOS12998.1 cleavage and polyadenylation specificity protein [Malassezia pachydermatis]
MAYAVHHQRVPASGFTHGVAACFVRHGEKEAHACWPTTRGRLLYHAVLARDDVLRVFEVRVPSTSATESSPQLVQVRMHRLFGEVTGIRTVRTIASLVDGRDRVLLSFRDAKMALMEWDDAYGDLNAVSLHTFERAEQLSAGLPSMFVPSLQVDPASRCAALLLPHDAIALVPLYQDPAELGVEEGQDASLLSQIPYAPSFIISVTEDVDASIRNIRDMVFLPGFQKPTLAVLYEPQLTWTGSLSRAKKTMRVSLVTLDVASTMYTVTVTSEWLPYHALYLVACPESLGGVMIVTPFALWHMDQTARMVGLSTSAWSEKTCDTPLRHDPDLEDVDLQGSTLTFTDATQGLLLLASGDVYAFQCAVEGRTVTSLSLTRVAGERQASASFVTSMPGGYLLCGSVQQDTCLYTLETVLSDEAPLPVSEPPMDEDELDLYGESLAAPALTTTHRRTALMRLRVCDAIPTLAPVHGIATGSLRDAMGHVQVHTIVATQQGLVTYEPRVRYRRLHTIAPAQDVWSGLAADSLPLLLIASDDEDTLVYALEAPTPRFLAQLTDRTVHCGTTTGGLVRVTTREAQVLSRQGAIVSTFGARDGVTIVSAHVMEAYAVLVGSDGLASVWQYASAWTHLADRQATHAVLWMDPTQTWGHAAWLATVSQDGHLTLSSLPACEPQWTCTSLGVLPSRLDDGGVATQEPLHVAHIALCEMGDVPMLTVQYTNGQLAVYEARLSTSTWDFVRVDARMLSAPAHALLPWRSRDGHRGLAVAGADAMLLLRDRLSPVLQWEADMPFASLCAHPTEAAVSILVDDGYAVLVTWHACQMDAPVPYTRWSTGRPYTHVGVHDETACLVAASVQPTAFVLYNDEDVPVQDPALDPTPTYTGQGALELFARLGEPPVHGYEFEANEVVLALHMAPLDCLDRGTGRRAMVAVGTMSWYGEDRTTRGHMYVFDVVESVPTATSAPGDAMRLRLLCREEMRAPVTALHDMHGFLVASVGQKLLIRSLEYSEWLVTIAFMDTAFYTTDIQRVKNFLLLTDYHKGAYFVAFQEDPARLVFLGREYVPTCALQGALLIDRSKLALVTCDPTGCIRLLDYQPSNPTSLGGQRLLVRCEYHTAGEVAQTLVLHGPRLASLGECFTSEILLAKHNGALDILVPVNERIFPTLQLFQSQLVRTVRHTAGLHPRAFRAVWNDRTSRPLAKGILDGTLLHTSECMSRPKLLDLVRDLSPRTGGVIADDVLRCLVHLQPHW